MTLDFFIFFFEKIALIGDVLILNFFFQRNKRKMKYYSKNIKSHISTDDIHFIRFISREYFDLA